MENPEREIRTVIRSLCQGTADEQRRTIERYFTNDASFVHPFCIVPHFHERHFPLFGDLSSRDVVRSIFQWYRMLSPRIDIEVDTALYDKSRDRIYADIRQVFSVWFIPFYTAPVRLVTVLDLVSNDDPDYHDPLDRILKLEDASEADEKATHAHQQSTSAVDHLGARTWKIHKQEDLYQVNEFLKFIGTSLVASVWYLFQLNASFICVLMALFLRLSPWAFQKEPARGGVESAIQKIDAYRDDGDGDDDDGYSKAGGKSVLGAAAGSTSGEDSHSTNGNRREAANSKASPSTHKKSAKDGGKKAGR